MLSFDGMQCPFQGKSLPLPVGSDELELVVSCLKSFVYGGVLEAAGSVKIS